MSMSLKRYKCPQCDKVSDGTGLTAHMMARGHQGDRIPQPDATHVNEGLGKYRRPKPQASTAVVPAKPYHRPDEGTAEITRSFAEFTIRVDEAGVWLKIEADDVARMLGGAHGNGHR